jgi:hypothetical protein
LDEYAYVHVKIHEDNVGALALGKLEPRWMTMRSKHYAIKYHWFWEHIGPHNIQLAKIGSKDQLGDLFQKTSVVLNFLVCERSSWVGNPWLLFWGGVWQVWI